ncbi:MAG: Gldg family protein [Lachnospiraceae bacterium]|nr:Gldg family protein [Lachnospiraceae bacterium]
MSAIYKRELQSYFRSFIGFLFIAVTLFFIGLYFSVYNILSGSPYFSYAVAGVISVFLISVPILTMRILAEEKHNKTDQLILTAPVSVGGIVMGKFLALLTIFAIPVAIICIYPLIMSRFGTVPMGEAYLAILAYFLFGMTAIAIGLLISSLTESQVIAAVLGFAVLFLGYMMSSICSVISTTGNLVTKILGCFDLYTPFANLLEGTLNVGSVVYFVSLTALVLFLTVQSIQKRRYSVSVKNFSIGAYSTGMIAVAVGIVIVVNIILGEMPSTWTAIDLTGQKLYSLTDQTKEFVSNMQEDVTIYVLANEDSQDTTLKQTLQRYDDLSDHITVECVDPAVNPMFYTKYTTGNISSNSLIVVSDKRSKVIDYSNIYESSFDYTTYSTTTTGYDGEGQITSALDYVLSQDMPKMYLTTGHGEYGFSSTFSSALNKENVEYETVNLMELEAVPEDAACLFINGAVKDFSNDDIGKVKAYLEKGGKVVLVIGYTEEDTPNLDSLLADMGMYTAEGLVIDQTEKNYYVSPYYLLPTQSASAYTSGLYGKYYIFAPYSQGIVIEDPDREDITYDIFLSTSDSAFSKTGQLNAEDFDKGAEDIDGPFAIGVEAVKPLEEGEAVLVAYGCEQIFTDEANQMVSGANQMLFTNTVSGFVDHEISVSIPVKSYEVSTLTVTQADIVWIALITVILMPVGCLIAGFVIWFRRRRR